MKLINKKTGEIGFLRVKLGSVFNVVEKFEVELATDEKMRFQYGSLAELHEFWEDYEEPKDNNYWYIDDLGKIQFSSEVLDEVAGYPNNCLSRKLFSNYFETKEEAEKAVEKLKAWKRLKDNGFKFNGIRENWVGRGESPLNYMRTDRTIHFNKQEDKDWLDENWNDLLLLFGGENDNN